MMNPNDYKLTGTYYLDVTDMEKHEGRMPNVHKSESTSEALPVGWVSVKDRLPRENDFVLAYDGVDIDTVWFRDGYFRDSDMTMLETMLIAHWMPLPAPPKD